MDSNAQHAPLPDVHPQHEATPPPGAHLTVVDTSHWNDPRTVRGVLRTALLNRIERAGERELRQRSAQEIAFILLTFAVAALLAGPALVPLVVALRGGQL